MMFERTKQQLMIVTVAAIRCIAAGGEVVAANARDDTPDCLLC